MRKVKVTRGRKYNVDLGRALPFPNIATSQTSIWICPEKPWNVPFCAQTHILSGQTSWKCKIFLHSSGKDPKIRKIVINVLALDLNKTRAGLERIWTLIRICKGSDEHRQRVRRCPLPQKISPSSHLFSKTPTEPKTLQQQKINSQTPKSKRHFPKVNVISPKVNVKYFREF